MFKEYRMTYNVFVVHVNFIFVHTTRYTPCLEKKILTFFCITLTNLDSFIIFGMNYPENSLD